MARARVSAGVICPDSVAGLAGGARSGGTVSVPSAPTARRKAATTSGQNCVPAQRCSSARAASSPGARR